MNESQSLCWISYKARDIKMNMIISKQQATTPRIVTGVIRRVSPERTMTIKVDNNWQYLKEVSYDHQVDVLCDSKTKKPIIYNEIDESENINNIKTTSYYIDECKQNIIKKGLIPIKIIEQMTLNEMLEHLLRYLSLGEIWIPKRLEVINHELIKN
ncbi:MAG: hypothetical protein WCR19_04550 [Acholeplasmataceae bacterium]